MLVLFGHLQSTNPYFPLNLCPSSLPSSTRPPLLWLQAFPSRWLHWQRPQRWCQWWWAGPNARWILRELQFNTAGRRFKVSWKKGAEHFCVRFWPRFPFWCVIFLCGVCLGWPDIRLMGCFFSSPARRPLFFWAVAQCKPYNSQQASQFKKKHFWKPGILVLTQLFSYLTDWMG